MTSSNFRKKNDRKKTLPSLKFQTPKELTNMSFRGILSGNTVWISVDKKLIERLESFVIGTVEIGKDLADPLNKLLEEAPIPPLIDKSKRLYFPTFDLLPPENYGKSRYVIMSQSDRILVRLSAEEALFLVHLASCLHVYIGRLFLIYS